MSGFFDPFKLVGNTVGNVGAFVENTANDVGKFVGLSSSPRRHHHHHHHCEVVEPDPATRLMMSQQEQFSRIARAAHESRAQRDDLIFLHLAAGEEHLKKKDSQGALSEFDAALKLDPQDAHAKASKIKALKLDAQCAAEALEALMKATDKPIPNKAAAEIYKQQLQGIDRRFQRAIQSQIVVPQAASLQQEIASVDAAIQQFEAQEKERIAQAKALVISQKLFAGNDYLEQRKPQDALLEFNGVLKLDPKNAQAAAGRLKAFQLEINLAAEESEPLLKKLASDEALSSQEITQAYKATLQRYQKKFLAFMEWNVDVPHLGTINQLIDKLDAKILEFEWLKLEQSLAEGVIKLKSRSLHTEDDLEHIVNDCFDWIETYKKLRQQNPQRAALFHSEKVIMEAICEQAGKSQSLLEQIEEGTFFLKIAKELIEIRDPKGKLTEKDEYRFISLFTMFADTPHLRTHIIQLTEEGLDRFKIQVRNHIEPHLKEPFFSIFSSTFKLSSKAPIVPANLANAWINAGLEFGTIPEIYQRFPPPAYAAPNNPPPAIQILPPPPPYEVVNSTEPSAPLYNELPEGVTHL